MNVFQKAQKIFHLMKEESSFLGVDIYNEKITVYVSSTYLAEEIKESFQELLNVTVYVGRRTIKSK
jgi:hypothetical protein